MIGRRFGFTTRASCLLAAGLTAVLCGFVLGEIDLVRAGILAAAIPVAASVVVHRSRLRVANRRSLEPTQITAGQSVTIHLTITNRSVLPTGALMLEDQLPERLVGRARFVLDSLSGREARTVSYRLPTLGRGRYRAGPLRIKLGDPFHMIDLTRSFTATNEFVVTPVVDRLPPLEPPRSDEMGHGTGSHSIGAHGADDASTREYRIGDDLRKIHWRSSARTGSLMVRQEERPWRTQSTVVLDLRADAHASSPDDRSAGIDPRSTNSLEWAISAAASVATQAMRSGRDVGLIGDPSQPDRLRFGDSAVLADHLACVRSNRHHDLAALAGPIRTAARDSSVIAILGRLTANDLRMLADAHPRARTAPALAVLLDADSWAVASDPVPADHGTAPLAAGSPAPGALASPNDADGTTGKGQVGEDLAKAATLLRNAGWRVAIVRRGMGIAEVWQLLLTDFARTHSMAALR